MNFPNTFEEFKKEWLEFEKQPKDPNLKIRCICGKCDITIKPLSDKGLRELWELLNHVELQEKA